MPNDRTELLCGVEGDCNHGVSVHTQGDASGGGGTEGNMRIGGGTEGNMGIGTATQATHPAQVGVAS